jgi:hypothetical protein
VVTAADGKTRRYKHGAYLGVREMTVDPEASDG